VTDTDGFLHYRVQVDNEARWVTRITEGSGRDTGRFYGGLLQNEAAAERQNRGALLARSMLGGQH
jgi:hypothetical protein